MHKIKKQILTYNNGKIYKLTQGAVLLITTACGNPEPALTETQKLALNHLAYERNITGQSPIEGYELVDRIKLKNRIKLKSRISSTQQKAWIKFLEDNKDGLKEIKNFDFVKEELQAGVYIINGKVVKLESTKSADSGIRDTDFVESRVTGITIAFEFKLYSKYKSDLLPGDNNVYENIEKA